MLVDCAAVISVPLTHLINLSLQSGIYPSDWKITKVLPIYKSDTTSDISNYRPISVIPAISKVAEKIVHSQLIRYFENTKLFSSDQFGFRKQRSTELAAVHFTDKIRKKVNEGKMVGCIFIDLTKAFDTLSHSKIIEKLKSYGIQGIELEWFIDYLFNRWQRVLYNNTLSEFQNVTNGVPQGSILGPLLFTIYFNDFHHCLKHSKCVKYADDTVIYVPGKDLFIIETRLTSDMQAIAEWCIKNELILNLKKGKTEVMVFGTPSHLSRQESKHINIMYQFQHIHVTNSYKYLGIELTPSLNPTSNFMKSMKKANSRLRLLKKVRDSITTQSAKSIYHSMIMPAITYSSLLHLKPCETHKKMLSTFHGRCLRVIYRNQMQPDDIMSPYSIMLFKCCTLVRKCLMSDVCDRFENYFQLTNHNIATRNKGYLIKLPKIQLEYSRPSFYYMGAWHYNNLPLSLRSQESFVSFKADLKRHLLCSQ